LCNGLDNNKMPRNDFEYQVMTDLQGYFTLKQIDTMLNLAQNKEEQILILLLSRTGRRITEILGRKAYLNKNANHPELQKEYNEVIGLRPIDINFESGQAAFNILKKRKAIRKLKPLDDFTLTKLQEYITETNIESHTPIFKLNRWKGFRIVKRLANEAGIGLVGTKEPHPHHFRHSFAVQILKNSNDPTDIKKLQQILEHSNMNITAGYLQFNQEELRKTINKVFEKKEE